MKSLIATAAMLASLTNAAAGVIHEAAISGHVLQNTREGAVTACGLSLFALELGPLTSDSLYSFSGSFMVTDAGGGVVKGRAATISGKDVARGSAGRDSVRPLETNSVWLRAPGSKATTVLEGQTVTQSDAPGFIIYASDFGPLVDFTLAILQRSAIQIGFATKGAQNDVILSGAVRMSNSQLEQFRQCIAELAENRKQNAE